MTFKFISFVTKTIDIRYVSTCSKGKSIVYHLIVISKNLFYDYSPYVNISIYVSTKVSTLLGKSMKHGRWDMY